MTYRNARGAGVLTLLLLLFAGCSNSKMVVGTLYDRLDDQIRSEFNKLGDFNKNQKADFENILQTFHYWHRRQELPLYAQLLRDVKKSASTRGATHPTDVKQWFDHIEQFADKAQACYPVHFSLHLIKSLRNEQIDFIQRRFQSERTKNREKRKASTREERMQKRLDNITKWSSRVGFTFTRRQERLLKDTMLSTKSLYDYYYSLSEDWNQRTFKVVRQRNQPGFETQMKQQLGSMFRLVETHYPVAVSENRELWRDFAHRFVQSLTGDQRIWINAWLGKLANTLDKIAKDNVSFKAHRNASIGCLPESNS